MNPKNLPSQISIGIMGTPFASGNRGVLALGAAIAGLCLDAAPTAKIRLFGSHRDAGPVVMCPRGTFLNIHIVRWRMSLVDGLQHHLFVILAASFLLRFVPVNRLRERISETVPWISELQSTNFIGDVRGGDSFSDIYGLKRFLIATLPVLSVIWVKRSLVLFPQTYGPFKNPASRGIARWIIRHASTVIARDRESQRIAQELAAPGQTVQLSPDVAFALHAEDPGLVQLDKSSPELLPSDLLGLNVNGLMFNGGYTGKNMFGLKMDYRSFVTELAIELLAVHPGNLLLVPHTYAPAGDVESDNDACRLLKESLPLDLQVRVRIVTGEYNAHQLKGIIARCSFFVGSRMHSCIAALSQGVPCVGVAYSMKFRGVFESVGMADWVVDGRVANNATAIQATIHLYRQKDAIKETLLDRAAEAKSRLQELFATLLTVGAG